MRIHPRSQLEQVLPGPAQVAQPSAQLPHTVSCGPPHGTASYWFAAHDVHAAHPRSEAGPQACTSKNPGAQLAVHAVHTVSLVDAQAADS